ncbi:uncharacterized protein LOC143594283 [Bidens hawaiensis]|uniref:uncharacterized protein LOC143594283 n=1 Tax=Bidens hawaiensis TaxID=980011 RepID=UPI00404B8D4D
MSALPIPILFFLITIAVTASPTTVLRLPSDDLCPVKCFRPDPVCGVDNVTYWCGCSEAHCAGVRVAKQGFCDFENGGTGEVSGQALLLVHILWLMLLGFFVLFGLL